MGHCIYESIATSDDIRIKLFKKISNTLSINFPFNLIKFTLLLDTWRGIVRNITLNWFECVQFSCTQGLHYLN